MADEKPEVPKKIRDRRDQFSIDLHRYGESEVTVPVGWTLQDVVKPEFWTEVAYHFRENKSEGRSKRDGSRIHVRTQDHAWYALLYVLGVSAAGLHVTVLFEKPNLQGRARIDETAPFEIRWNVGKRGFDIIRKSDRALVVDGSQLPTKELAAKWIEDSMQQRAA